MKTCYLKTCSRHCVMYLMLSLLMSFKFSFQKRFYTSEIWLVNYDFFVTLLYFPQLWCHAVVQILIVTKGGKRSSNLMNFNYTCQGTRTLYTFPRISYHDTKHNCFQRTTKLTYMLMLVGANNKEMRMNNVCDHPWMVPTQLDSVWVSSLSWFGI